jgi:hypothetical protein
MFFLNHEMGVDEISSLFHLFHILGINEHDQIGKGVEPWRTI